jgi:hypothetical protein
VLSEFVQNAGIVALLLGLVLLFVMLVLGMIIVIRARKEDLPEVVHGLAEWSVEAGSSPIYNSRLVEAETVSTYRAPSGLCS